MNEVEKALNGMKNIAEYWSMRPSEQEAANIAISALEKQIQRASLTINEAENKFICPSCSKTIVWLDDKTRHKHCLNCGQALKWGE